MKLSLRKCPVNGRKDVAQEVDETAVGCGSIDEPQRPSWVRRSREKLSLNALRDDHQLLGRRAIQPAKDICEELADDKNPVDARMEPGPAEAPPGDRQRPPRGWMRSFHRDPLIVMGPKDPGARGESNPYIQHPATDDQHVRGLLLRQKPPSRRGDVIVASAIVRACFAVTP